MSKKIYKPVQPHPLTCKRCGGIFQGKYRQCYCPDCIRSGGGLLRKYGAQRKECIE